MCKLAVPAAATKQASAVLVHSEQAYSKGAWELLLSPTASTREASSSSTFCFKNCRYACMSAAKAGAILVYAMLVLSVVCAER